MAEQGELKVIKRDGRVEPFDIEKIKAVLGKIFDSLGPNREVPFIPDAILFKYVIKGAEDGYIKIQCIQNNIADFLMYMQYFDAAKAYITYREKHKEARFIKDRIDYMDKYSETNTNAATASETDPNANVSIKNVASLESEVYKLQNRIIQRQRIKDQLYKTNPEVAKEYEKDLEHHIIYTNDEASSPSPKFYCQAVSLYPLMTQGVGNIDGITPSAPNDLHSFSGQITNLIFTLSSQCKGAVAVGEYFIALNYYVINEFGPNWFEKLDMVTTTSNCLLTKTVKTEIYKAFKQFVWGVNQPQGNRSYQSPLRSLVLSNKFYIFAA